MTPETATARRATRARRSAASAVALALALLAAPATARAASDLHPAERQTLGALITAAFSADRRLEVSSYDELRRVLALEADRLAELGASVQRIRVDATLAEPALVGEQLAPISVPTKTAVLAVRDLGPGTLVYEDGAGFSVSKGSERYGRLFLRSAEQRGALLLVDVTSGEVLRTLEATRVEWTHDPMGVALVVMGRGAALVSLADGSERSYVDVGGGAAVTPAALLPRPGEALLYAVERMASGTVKTGVVEDASSHLRSLQSLPIHLGGLERRSAWRTEHDEAKSP